MRDSDSAWREVETRLGQVDGCWNEKPSLAECGMRRTRTRVRVGVSWYVFGRFCRYFAPPPREWLTEWLTTFQRLIPFSLVLLLLVAQFPFCILGMCVLSVHVVSQKGTCKWRGFEWEEARHLISILMNSLCTACPALPRVVQRGHNKYTYSGACPLVTLFAFTHRTTSASTKWVTWKSLYASLSLPLSYVGYF